MQLSAPEHHLVSYSEIACHFIGCGEPKAHDNFAQKSLPGKVGACVGDVIARFELYLPAVAMLGMASEGAWIELGLALLKANPTNLSLTNEKREKDRDTLTSPHSSVLQKMETVIDLYRRADVYKNVAQRSGYNHRILGEVLNWSNVIRDSRNALHYGADAASRNTYEKVAALLLGANQNFRILYAIRRAAKEFV